MPLFTAGALTGLGAILAGTAVAATAAGTGYAIASGEDQKKKQADALKKQEQAQNLAARNAESQRRSSEMALNAANRKSPDVSSIMGAASQAGGASSTMLTGNYGVDPNALSLGKSSLLGS